MALFKIFKGTSANLPTTMVDGYCYFTTDDGQFYIDYLDSDGVTLKRKPISGPGQSIEYIVGTQTAATGSWAGITKDSALVAGKTIAYKLPYAGSGNASLTLTFTNPAAGDPANSGAIPVYINTSRTTTHYGAGSVVIMTYDGTNWRTTDYWNSNDTTTTYARFANGAFAPITSLYRYQLLLSHPTDSSKVIPANTTSNTTGTNKATITTESFNPFDYIYYYNTTGTVSANTNISVSYVWYGHPAVDLRYSFNTGSTLVANKDIYLVAKLQSDGTAKLRNPGATGANASAQATGNDAGPVTQILPSTEDGYIYIKIGHAYDTYRMVLTFNHPIYVFKDGGIRPYSYFTDENVEQIIQTDNAEHKILITTSDSPTSGESTAVGYGENLAYNPSLNRLSTGNLRLTGELDVTGNAYLHNQTAADSLTAGSLLVTGNANFTQSPTAPTPASTSNDTTVATTEFVKSRIAAGVTGVKGNAESSYRVGNVNLTGANIIGSSAIGSSTKPVYWTGSAFSGVSKYTVEHTSGGSNEYRVTYGSTIDMSMMVGTGNENHGLYDNKAGKWMIVADTNGNVTVNGNATTATGFASAKTIALTGNVTGSATGGNGSNGWSIATTIGIGVVTNAMLAGSIANGKLANSSISIAGNSVSLGGSLAADTLRTSLGLSNAMHFIGVATVAITDGSTTNPTISGYDFTADRKPGDVIIDSDTSYEYVWTLEGKWERLGPDGSYKTVQSAVSSPSANGNATAFIDTISQNANGVITVTKKNLDTSGTWSGNATTATTASKLSNTSKIGDTNKPVYFKADGTPAAISYTIDKSVPSNAVFTDRYVNSATFADDSTNTAASPIKMTLTRAGSDTATVTANIPKVSSSSAGVAPKGAAVSSQSQTTKFLREDGTWATPSYTTNTNTTYTFTDGTDGSFSVTPSGGSAQTVSIGKPAMAGTADVANSVAWSNVTGKPSTYYTLPTAADSTLGGIKTGYSASGKNYAIKVDSNGNAYVNVPWTDNNTTSFTITANATDGLWDLTGTNGTNAVTYALAPYSTKQSSTSFYTAATNPTLTTRLNYDGYFYATKLYSGGAEVLTSHQSLANYKTKQTAVSDPAASNTAIAFIDSISQDTNGVITPTKKTVRSASTSQTGVVQLSSATNSTSETLAATAKAVKTAYDLANTANTTANNHKYWANVESTSAAAYNKAPEVASVKINGDTSASAASTKNVELVYDATLEVLNFVFS